MTFSENVIFTPVTDVKDAQIMRVIRNDCREYMTRDSSFISEDQQEKWFDHLNKDNIKMFLMHKCSNENAIYTIGFGYCRYDDNEVYLTGGLKPDCRDKGYGKKLFLYLLENAKSFNSRITLEVLNSNIRAKQLYEKIGFRSTETTDKITKMEYNND